MQSFEKQKVIDAAYRFVETMKELDREFKCKGETKPSQQAKARIALDFWSFVEVMDQCLHGDIKPLQKECRDIVGPWLFRSRYFNRSYHKPHGYAGDFRIVEWMYDIENDPCDDATQPGIVNLLDYVFSTVHSVQSVWERRHFFKRLLHQEYERNERRLRILDVACGGARYIQDFLRDIDAGAAIEITLVDQDAAALNFCKTVSLEQWASQLHILHIPVTRLASSLPEGEFDVVISAGLFDYLPTRMAKPLLAHMQTLTSSEGTLAITNFHAHDPSRYVKEWLVDWPLMFRTESEVLDLFPDPNRTRILHSPNKALVYANFSCRCTPVDQAALLATNWTEVL
jgi:SAM-dependent methyltransferase